MKNTLVNGTTFMGTAFVFARIMQNVVCGLGVRLLGAGLISPIALMAPTTQLKT